jgi:hypothetical protein
MTCELHVFDVTIVGNLQVPLQREYSGRTLHIVGNRHKLGESWSAEDGMVGSFEVRNLKLDVLGAVVLPCPEGNWQNY